MQDDIDPDARPFPGIVVVDTKARISPFYAHYVDEDDCEWGWGDTAEEAVRNLKVNLAPPEDRPILDEDEPYHQQYCD